MFWGLLLKANKRYSQAVTKAFHISHATLDVTANDVGSDVVQVWVNIDDENHLICNLTKNASHVPLDLAFSEGENVAFYSKGNGVVHLTGFLLPEEPDYGFDGLEEEENEDEIDEEVLKNLSKQNKSKKVAQKSNSKEESDDDDEEDDDEDDDDDLMGEDDDDDDDEEDDEDDDDDDDDDEEEEEEEVAAPAKKQKLEKGAKQNGVANGKPPKQAEPPKKKQKVEQKQQQQPQKPQQQQQPSQKPQKKTLANGVIIEELRVGKGPEAKQGKRVQVYYEGRLKNGKVFDSTKSGEGFKFALGRGEVINGWDVGVAGMKVGGKRRITCPPNAAYGPRGQPPVIPPNSTLTFEVDLRGVN